MLLRLEMPYVSRQILGGAVIKWHKAEGERVDPGDDLFDIQIRSRKTLRVPESPSHILKGKVFGPAHGTREGLELLRVTSTDLGFLRKICANRGVTRKVGELIAVLSTDQNEPFNESDQVLTEASQFRVVANIIQPS